MPGVIICEAAAQLCSYYVMNQHVIEEGQIMGFGGMENVRFRAVVKPGDLGEVMQRTQHGVREEEKLERQNKGKDTREDHQAHVEIIDLVGGHVMLMIKIVNLFV